MNLLSDYPPTIGACRSSGDDILATAIETSLLKLSLIRAQAHIELYGISSPIVPKGNLSQALSSALKKSKRDEQRLAEEERALDHELGKYSRLLQMVDRSESGFSQVVEDWSRTQREMDDCRRDLRRLGWTGD